MTQKANVPKSTTGISGKQVGMALLCVLGFILFALFMAPFFVVIYSSAKTSAEISLDPFYISSVAQSCSTLCDPMNRSMPDLPVHHQLLEFTHTHAH